MSIRSMLVVVVLAFTGLNVQAAERGSLKNTTKVTLTYQAGYANDKGYVSWQTFKLAPGETHVWTIENPKRWPLHIQWDYIAGDGKVTMQRSILRTQPNGFTSGLFFYGKQIWIDTSGGTK